MEGGDTDLLARILEPVLPLLGSGVLASEECRFDLCRHCRSSSRKEEGEGGRCDARLACDAGTVIVPKGSAKGRELGAEQGRKDVRERGGGRRGRTSRGRRKNDREREERRCLGERRKRRGAGETQPEHDHTALAPRLSQQPSSRTTNKTRERTSSGSSEGPAGRVLATMGGGEVVRGNGAWAAGRTPTGGGRESDGGTREGKSPKETREREKAEEKSKSKVEGRKGEAFNLRKSVATGASKSADRGVMGGCKRRGSWRVLTATKNTGKVEWGGERAKISIPNLKPKHSVTSAEAWLREAGVGGRGFPKPGGLQASANFPDT